MSDEVVDAEIIDTSQKNWKQNVLITGTAVGAILGFLTAFLMARQAEEQGGELRLQTGDMMRIGLALVTTVRSISALGSGEKGL